MTLPESSLAGAQLLDELKRNQREKGVVDVEEERVKIVIFRSGGGRYAFRGQDVREILSGVEISWVPSLPDFLPGLINVRGDVESVIDIACFLAGHGTAEPTGLVAMAVRGEFRSGVLVDSIDDVVDIPVNAIRPPLGTLTGAAREIIGAVIEVEGAAIPLIDLEKLAAKVTL